MGQLTPYPVPQVGIFGLNKQNQDTNLPLGWATEAINLVFNERGTLESRKGITARHASSYGSIKSLHQYIDSSGSTIIVFGSGTKLYKLTGSIVTDITGTAVATDGNWNFVTFNGTCVGYQTGHAPIVLESTLSTFKPSGNNQYNGSMVCSAFGRLWTVYNNVLYYSDLLINDFYAQGLGFTIDIGTVDADGVIDSSSLAIGVKGTKYQVDDTLTIVQSASSGTATIKVTGVDSVGGVTSFTVTNKGYDYSVATGLATSLGTQGSGAFDLSLYWSNGFDEAVAIREWNNLLFVFGKKSILVYGNPDDATNTMLIIDSISDAGCIARDTIQEVGNDMIFLSSGGLRSVGKLLQEKSVPFNDVSKNVKDYIISLISAESNKSLIKSAYSQSEGFYAITFPTSNKTLIFDVSSRLEDGTYRCTEWDSGYSAMLADIDANLILAKSGVVNSYTGYTDNTASYTITYEGVWNDFGNELSAYLKIPKKIRVFLSGTDGDIVTVNMYYDYKDTPRIETATILNDKIETPIFGSGEVVKVGFQSVINGSKKSFKKYNLFVNVGKF